ncbi:MAG: MerR family transcriptional regulator [Acidimicrobiia bacterium]
MTTDDFPELLRVGDIAAAAGLTVRALHHYEQIGLLAPSTRTAAGHRLYGSEALSRLYAITRLRRLGLTLEQIGQALDDPEWSLTDALRQHLAETERQMQALTTLRNAVTTALTDLANANDPTDDLLGVLSAMDLVDNPLRRRISILVYRDLAAAHRYLVEVFGFTPGEVTVAPDGTVVHAEVFAGDGVIWLHPETEEYRLASPATLGRATATMAIMVDDVDDHFRIVQAKGGEIVYPPIDQPYGYREYSARDREGTLWSFMKELEDS